MHEKIINFAIKHKKHIFCEKPCSLNLKKIDKIIKKIKEKKFFISHMVNYEMMELKAFKYFSSLIRKKKLKINSIVLNGTYSIEQKCIVGKIITRMAGANV